MSSSQRSRSSSDRPNVNNNNSTPPPPSSSVMFACSRDETLLLSPTGEVIACQSQGSVYDPAFRSSAARIMNEKDHHPHKKSSSLLLSWPRGGGGTAACDCASISLSLQNAAICGGMGSIGIGIGRGGDAWKGQVLHDDETNENENENENEHKQQHQQQQREDPGSNNVHDSNNNHSFHFVTKRNHRQRRSANHPQKSSSSRKNENGEEREGLLGGNTSDVITSLSSSSGPGRRAGDKKMAKEESGPGPGRRIHSPSSPPSTFQEQAAVAFRSPPLKSIGGPPPVLDDASSIVPIASFDYSHFGDNDDGNDMLPETPRPNHHLHRRRGSSAAANIARASPPQSPPHSHAISSSSSLKHSNPLAKHAATATAAATACVTACVSNGSNHKEIADEESAHHDKDETIVPAAPHSHAQHSHYYDDHDDPFFHGVPRVHPAFAGVRITHISAHPCGAHVLLISDAGLLYSYGLNNYGQLGIGVRNHHTIDSTFTTGKEEEEEENKNNKNHKIHPPAQARNRRNAAAPVNGHAIMNRDDDCTEVTEAAVAAAYHSPCAYVTTPTIVTPLLENGGKAIACAAGVNHSLVLIEIDERRIVKNPQAQTRTPSNQHQHQHHPSPCLADAHSSSSHDSASRASDPTRPHTTPFDRPPTPTPTQELMNSANDTVVYHQVYGFGRNNCMKIGLIRPDTPVLGNKNTEAETKEAVVVLPRRVALSCRVQHQGSSRTMRSSSSLSSFKQQSSASCDEESSSSSDAISSSSSACPPPFGVFDIQAGADHSAALVRRENGKIELYTWGNARFGALGCPPIPATSSSSPSSSEEEEDGPRSRSCVQQPTPPSLRKPRRRSSLVSANRSSVNTHVILVPSIVSTLSQSDPPEKDDAQEQQQQPQPQETSLLRKGEYPKSCSLGNQCSFVLTNQGRLFSFGSSASGMLGLGPNIVESSRPSQVLLPPVPMLLGTGGDDATFTSVSAGGTHVLATTEKGAVMAWGSHIPVGLPVNHNHKNSSALNKNNKNNNEKLLIDENISWTPRLVPFASLPNTQAVTPYTNSNVPSVVDEDKTNRNGPTNSTPAVVKAIAGYDCSFFVTASGHVLSSGVPSGRLGQGDASSQSAAVETLRTPTPPDDAHVGPQSLFGGFRLWFRSQ